MSRSTTVTAVVAPRFSLRDRLDALAALCPELQVTPTGRFVTPSLTQTELAIRVSHALTSLATPRRLAVDVPVTFAVAETQLGSLPAHLIEATDQLIVAAAVDRSLEALGMFTTRATTEHESALVTAARGQVGDQQVLVVQRNGILEIDVLGCEATTCEPTVDRLLDELRRAGLTIEEEDAQTHADPEGGTLIRRAAASARSTGQTLEAAACRLPHRPAGRARQDADRQAVNRQRLGGDRG